MTSPGKAGSTRLCVDCGAQFTVRVKSTRSYCDACTAKRMIQLSGTRPNKGDRPRKGQKQ